MNKILIYSKAHCGYCTMAKDLLTRLHYTFEEIRVDLDPSKQEELQRLTTNKTLPQIFIQGKNIGGYDDLAELVKSGKLENLLTAGK